MSQSNFHPFLPLPSPRQSRCPWMKISRTIPASCQTTWIPLHFALGSSSRHFLQCLDPKTHLHPPKTAKNCCIHYSLHLIAMNSRDGWSSFHIRKRFLSENSPPSRPSPFYPRK